MQERQTVQTPTTIQALFVDQQVILVAILTKDHTTAKVQMGLKEVL